MPTPFGHVKMNCLAAYQLRSQLIVLSRYMAKELDEPKVNSSSTIRLCLYESFDKRGIEVSEDETIPKEILCKRGSYKPVLKDMLRYFFGENKSVLSSIKNNMTDQTYSKRLFVPVRMYNTLPLLAAHIAEETGWDVNNLTPTKVVSFSMIENMAELNVPMSITKEEIAKDHLGLTEKTKRGASPKSRKTEILVDSVTAERVRSIQSMLDTRTLSDKLRLPSVTDAIEFALQYCVQHPEAWYNAVSRVTVQTQTDTDFQCRHR